MHTGRRSVVTIGAYDGVHIGHRQVIESVRRLATERDLRSVVVTFDRHPASVVRPESAPKLLCDLAQKLELLAATGVDDVVVVGFDKERANEPAEDFVEEVLGDELAAAAVVVGRDFHFGRGRGGNVALLETMGARLGFEVMPFALVPDPVNGKVVSSTEIRRLIAAGELDEASRLLGRPHEVRGPLLPPAHRLGTNASGAEASTSPARSGDGGGGDCFLVDVPFEILRPPRGLYAVLAGSARSSAVLAADLSSGSALVPADETDALELRSPASGLLGEAFGAAATAPARGDAPPPTEIARVLFLGSTRPGRG